MQLIRWALDELGICFPLGSIRSKPPLPKLELQPPQSAPPPLRPEMTPRSGRGQRR
jgi:hypothetical protein